ncbi:hypothetical protein, variant [Aphanomyces astaci]|uniref:Uncharacterized protein n=1 Tax=Aphanomyces astaci TaxID=112090 RepID=W4GZ38_APHAT|nr:hypothetical protein, variant [Aphanomyces astaci]ETV84576.1 hypothetical protein, variant [Aphanomyces astaci]|eukprot:XP_009826268.1 hypothetical protein, variant [Aphanomyces astaci]
MSMKKSVFLAYAEDSDEDDTIFSRDQGDKSAKSSKQKQKQKAKKQEENALKSLAMTSSSKKSKKKKGQSNGAAVDVVAVDEAIKQVTVEETPPAPVAVVPTATYANASAAAKKTAPAASTSTPPPPLQEAPRTQAPPPSVPKPKQQPKVAPKQQQQQVAQKQPPPSPSQPQVKSNDKYIPPNARNNPSAQGRQGTPFQSVTHLERVASPPPRSTPSSSGVTYVPSHIQVLLPGQPEQVLDVEDVMQRAQYFKQTAESLLTVNRNGEMENSQLREHLTQALLRLEQVEHENRVLQQLNLNLQTEVVALRAPSTSAFNHAAAAAVRPPGL